MLPSKLQRVLFAQHKVDFRRGFDGLLAEARRLGADPYAGDCVIFVKRDWTQIRAILGDGVGLFMVFRRFEGSTLRSLLSFTAEPSARTITTAELSLLLEGAQFTVHTRARPWQSQKSRLLMRNP